MSKRLRMYEIADDIDSNSDEPTPSPKASMERKAKLVSDEPTPNSPKSSLERKAKLVSDEPTPSSPKSSMERKAKLVKKLKQGFKGTIQNKKLNK